MCSENKCKSFEINLTLMINSYRMIRRANEIKPIPAAFYFQLLFWRGKGGTGQCFLHDSPVTSCTSDEHRLLCNYMEEDKYRVQATTAHPWPRGGDHPGISAGRQNHVLVRHGFLRAVVGNGALWNLANDRPRPSEFVSVCDHLFQHRWYTKRRSLHHYQATTGDRQSQKDGDKGKTVSRC